MSLSTSVRAHAPTQSSDHIHRTSRYFHTLPSALAVLAGVTLLAASATTNALYGWQKSDFLPQQITWAAVSVAASIVLALSPTAILNALRSRSLAAGVMALLAMGLTGAYSFTAAIGASAGQRMSSQVESDGDAGQRARNQLDYDNAAHELAATSPARPTAELQALIDKTLKANPGARCDLKPGDPEYGAVSRKTCPDVATLEAELARSERRGELEAVKAKASKALDALKPKIANTDATAIASYLSVAGIVLSVDALNRWLALLAVALVEWGGGLAFALGQVLKRTVDDTHDTQLASNEAPASNLPKATIAENEEEANKIKALLDMQPVSNSVPTKLDVPEDFGGRMMALLESRGGEVYSGQRSLARALGCSPAHVGNVLRDLSGQGLVTVDATKTGTVVRLMAETDYSMRPQSASINKTLTSVEG